METFQNYTSIMVLLASIYHNRQKKKMCGDCINYNIFLKT